MDIYLITDQNVLSSGILGLWHGYYFIHWRPDIRKPDIRIIHLDSFSQEPNNAICPLHCTYESHRHNNKSHVIQFFSWTKGSLISGFQCNWFYLISGYLKPGFYCNMKQPPSHRRLTHSLHAFTRRCSGRAWPPPAGWRRWAPGWRGTRTWGRPPRGRRCCTAASLIRDGSTQATSGFRIGIGTFFKAAHVVYGRMGTTESVSSSV